MCGVQGGPNVYLRGERIRVQKNCAGFNADVALRRRIECNRWRKGALGDIRSKTLYLVEQWQTALNPGGHGSSCEQEETNKGRDGLVQTRGMTEEVPPRGHSTNVDGCTLLE